jgi:hypothetical protein
MFCAAMANGEAGAQQAKPTCKTSEVYDRIAVLRKRIELYDKRVGDAQVDVASAEAEVFTAQQKLKTETQNTAAARADAVEKEKKKSAAEIRKEIEASRKYTKLEGKTITDQDVEERRQQEIQRAGALPKDLSDNIHTAKSKLEAAQGRLRRASRELKNNRDELDALEKLPEECPPKGQTMVPGSGGELVKNSGRVRSTESLADTDLVTNRFTDSGDPLGLGIVAGYNFKPWNNSVVIGPFASFDYLNQTINHSFAGGQFLGTTTHWFINAGVKAGVVTAPGFFLYGLAGAAWLNHDLNVNFATAAQSNVTTPGFTLGAGGEYQPPWWQLAGHPVSLFAQYQHTWWDNANFNQPASSPAFNYAFRREDDTIKLGVNFYFGVAPAPIPRSPAYPMKALPLK